MDKKASNALGRLLKLSGAVTDRKNIHQDVIFSRSPSLNFTFGNGWGLPKGYSLLLYGPPRGGKSVVLNDMIGQLHMSDPDAVAIKFNTEMRETAQLDDSNLSMYGIDPNRLISYEVNTPDAIFDRIEKEIAAEIQDGLKVGLIGIDSLNAIQGRRGMNADTIMTQQIGDNALTIQEGLKRILPVQRKYNFGLVLTTHLRAEMSINTAGSASVRTGKDSGVRPAVSFGTQHHCEYYMYVQPVRGQDGKKDLLDNKLEDSTVQDLAEHGERTGHRIAVRMMDSSLGPKDRQGEFTFDYKRGIINVHEEVFLLGCARNVIDRPNNVMYAFGGKEWRGKPAMLEALKNDTQLQTAILTELHRRDREPSTT
jgi:hypothetical protein